MVEPACALPEATFMSRSREFKSYRGEPARKLIDRGWTVVARRAKSEEESGDRRRRSRGPIHERGAVQRKRRTNDLPTSGWGCFIESRRIPEDEEDEEGVSVCLREIWEWDRGRTRSGWMHSGYFWIDPDIRHRVFLDRALNCFG